MTFTPDGTAAYWPVIDQSDGLKRWIVESTMRSGVWERPRIAPFSKKGLEDDVPCISPDGKKFLFLSWRPLAPGDDSKKERIWMMRREGDGWSKPEPLSEAVNSLGEIHQQISVDLKGNLYFGCESPQGYGSMDLYVSEDKGGEFQVPVNLGPPLNGPAGNFRRLSRPTDASSCSTGSRTTGANS